MKVGHLIRTERVRQQMKQVVLAKGICTPSYLSKIERNLIEPSEDVMELLFNKLGIDVELLLENNQKKEGSFKKLIFDVYKEVITTRDDSFTREKLNYLERQNPF
ncbi:MAG TPA: helix-turn-helix transcriptional regulator, partial [Candidatus Nitrosocosmicus sp.]|nr:helix-turn-helix transcriptional regulator [Candidatus Nitrosocosmicus sp.]